MRARLFVIAIVILSLNINSCSITDFLTEISDDSAEQIFKYDSTLDNKGKHVTSLGELKVLFIFALFSDDTTVSSSSWQFSNNELPGWTFKMLNKTNHPEFPVDNLTQYFYEMSRGNLMLYGDIYPKPVIPKYSQDKYKSIADVNHEILLSLDSEIDYSEYDNWSKGKNYSFVNTPDGKADMIFILYRNFENRLFFNRKWTGAAHLFLTEDILTDDGIKIATGRLDRGSGIQSRGGKSGFEYIKYVLAHEFGHFLFGSGHIENVTNLALMTGGPVWNASRGMHSWEREKLNWIEYIDLPNNKNSSIISLDYMTSGRAYRLKLSDNEWYVFENHQRLSKNDWAQDKGIYIYHIQNPESFAPKITVKCADGNWDFEVKEDLEMLLKTMPNPSGKSEMNIIIPSKKINYACFKQVYGDNSAWGDEYDAFDVNYNNLISPVSNPSTNNNSDQNFAVYIKKKQGDNYLIDIYFENLYENSPPSIPQIEGIKMISNGELELNWLDNNEPDLAGYKAYIYSITGDGLSLSETIEISKNETSLSLSNKLQSDSLKYAAAISSFDISDKESNLSEFIELSFSDELNKWKWKRIEEY